MTDSRPQIASHAETLSVKLKEAAHEGLLPWMLKMSERIARIEAKQDHGLLQLEVHSHLDEKRFGELTQQINIAINASETLEENELDEKGQLKMLKRVLAWCGWIITTGLSLWAILHS